MEGNDFSWIEGFSVESNTVNGSLHAEKLILIVIGANRIVGLFGVGDVPVGCVAGLASALERRARGEYSSWAATASSGMRRLLSRIVHAGYARPPPRRPVAAVW